MEEIDENFWLNWRDLGCMATMSLTRDLIYKDHDDTQVLLLGHYKYPGNNTGDPSIMFEFK